MYAPPHSDFGDRRPFSNLAEHVGKTIPMERVAALKKEAYPTPEDYIEPLNAQHDKARDPNFVPQADKTTAPAEVNTLRNENLCPVCKASSMQVGRDGIMECPTCGHVQEPEPLNNPDLTLSEGQDALQNQTDGQPLEQGAEEDRITFTPAVATKQTHTEGVLSEMFETIITTESKDIVDRILPVTAAAKVARLEAPLGVNFPLNGNTYSALKEAGLFEGVTVEYPAAKKRIVLAESAPILHLFAADESAEKLMTEYENVPLVIEVNEELDAEKVLEIIRATSANKSEKTILPAGKEVTDKPKDEKVLSDQLEPVEAAVTVNINDSAEAPADEPAESAEDSQEDTSVEEVVEAVTDAEESAVEDGDEKESKLLKAFALADQAVEMGVVDSNDKLAFIAELEDETIGQLEAREKTLESIKQAGFKRSASAGLGLKRIPRLSHSRASISEDISLVAPDEALFL
jgi:uncharacterized Zn finger protein (UPF0148 family)